MIDQDPPEDNEKTSHQLFRQILRPGIGDEHASGNDEQPRAIHDIRDDRQRINKIHGWIQQRQKQEKERHPKQRADRLSLEKVEGSH